MTDIVIEFQNIINEHIKNSTPMDGNSFMDYINKINKHHKNEYMKNYIIDKPSLNCECGGIYKKHQLHIHRKSKKHIKYFAEKTN